MSPPLLYLDYDGVLHHHDVRLYRRRGTVCLGGPLFEHLPLLATLLAPYPMVRLVLSTSWVPARSYSMARKALRSLEGRVIGATFHSAMRREEFVAMPRGQQVVSDVARRKVAHWIAIDDDTEGWPAWVGERLVVSDSERGLGNPAVASALDAALAKLAREST